VTMHLAMVLPLVAGLFLAAAARPLARTLPPWSSVRLLTVASLVTAVAGGFSLAVLAFAFVAQDDDVAAVGHWSVPILRHTDPVPAAAGVLSTILVVVLFLAALVRTSRAAHDLIVAALTCRRLGSGVHGLVLVDDERPDAYALPGITGRVVVSTAMLRALPPGERRALLAHEASHLNHRHHLYVLIVGIAAAANPLLRPVANQVAMGIERWADEDAASETGDRRQVVRALALAARAMRTAPSRSTTTALGVDGSDVVVRARALLAPPPRQRHGLSAVLLAVTLVTAVSVPVVARATETAFERAQATWPVAAAHPTGVSAR
jgi:Zn-dependent protease with chaperone function